MIFKQNKHLNQVFLVHLQEYNYAFAHEVAFRNAWEQLASWISWDETVSGVEFFDLLFGHVSVPAEYLIDSL